MEATWWGAGATKVCLQVETEAELQELFRRAEKMNLPCHLVTDRGLTEFDGVPTVTALGIGPAPSEAIDEITRELKLF